MSASIFSMAGDAALFADPLSPSQLAPGLTRLLESGDLRKQLIERGRQRSQRYRWETGAAQSLEFFRNVGGDDYTISPRGCRKAKQAKRLRRQCRLR